jgi:hypothetical protein
MMADWTTLPNTAVGVGGLPSGATVTALRDNPVAIAEGAAGAPRIENAAHLPPVAGATYVLWSQNAEVSQSSGVTSYEDVNNHRYFDRERHVGVLCLVAGVIRCTFDHRSDLNGISVSARIIKNGTQLAEWSTSSNTYTSRSLDVTVDVGDQVIFQQVKASTAGAIWRNLRVSSANPNFAVA